MMCQYCEPIHKFEEYDPDIEERWRTVMATKAIYGYCDKEKGASEIWIKGNTLCADNSGGEYNTSKAKIKFCPMCGRKLTEAK